MATPADDPADLIRALMSRLELNQVQVAERSRGYLRQETVSRVLSGENKLGSYKAQLGFAHAFRARTPELEAYLAGRRSLEQMTAAYEARAYDEAGSQPRAMAALPADDDASALERALKYAFDAQRHELEDLDRARVAVRETARLMREDVDHVARARDWLEAARQLRLDGAEVTTLAIVMRVSESKMPAAAQQAVARDDAVNAAIDAQLRDKGREAGDRADALAALKKKPR